MLHYAIYHKAGKPIENKKIVKSNNIKDLPITKDTISITIFDQNENQNDLINKKTYIIGTLLNQDAIKLKYGENSKYFRYLNSTGYNGIVITCNQKLIPVMEEDFKFIINPSHIKNSKIDEDDLIL